MPLVINSKTQPHAYAFLHRLCEAGEKKGVSEDVLRMWRSKGPDKNKLLELFVTRCYNREADAHSNRAKLEALIKFRQTSKEFKKTFQGYSWLTEKEMKEKNWNDAKIAGAKAFCEKKKLTKQCIYEKVTKYLVQVSDDVESL